MTSSPSFDYDLAFSRNLGWITEAEQLSLRGKCIAIAGLGGVGGVHLLSLARLGIGRFRIADFDTFDLQNFNRQIGATVDTIGRPKIDVLAEMARAINPEVRIELFRGGVNETNLDEFLSSADLFVDGLDFFALGIRRRVFNRCAELGISAVTAAPIGFGTCFLAFTPTSMSFEDYFRFEGKSEQDQYISFLVGLTPRALHRSYLVDPSRVDLAAHKGPSTVAACQLCAGVTAIMAVKLLVKRGDVRPAPWHHHFDGYRLKFKSTPLRFGNAGPLQRIKVAVGRKIYARMARTSTGIGPEPVRTRAIERILDAARWAPSGDNKQPWRFDILGDDTVSVQVAPPDPVNVYEYRNGEPLVLAAGMLVETIRIAATAHSRTTTWTQDANASPPRITLRFTEQVSLPIDPLFSSIGLRTVDRRRYRMRTLTTCESSQLTQSVAGVLALDWYTGLKQRWQFARLSASATWIRLQMKEAYSTHREAIDWERRLSPNGIPAGALGLDSATISLMRWAMRDWSRLEFLNRLGGATTPALQMDYIPIISSSAVFVMRPLSGNLNGDADRTIKIGQAIQRFWLTAARLGLAVQPALATLIFADHGNDLVCSKPTIREKAAVLAQSFRVVTGHSPRGVVFMGRVGEPLSSLAACRSTRRPLSEMMNS